LNNGSFTSVQTVHAHTSFYTEELLHTEAFTQRTLAKEDHEHLSDVSKSQFLLGFGPLTFIPCKRVASEVSKPQFYQQFLTLGAHFARQGGTVAQKMRISTHVRASSMRDPRRGVHRKQKIAFHHTVVRPSRAICSEVAPDDFKAFHHTFVGPMRAISADGCSSPKQNSHFTTPLRARHARSTEKVRFRNPPPDCPCRLKREFRRTWEVGVV